jgi:glyoxylase-like metal-dependent hydrolase (beta-lactamase superfamily II)
MSGSAVETFPITSCADGGLREVARGVWVLTHPLPGLMPDVCAYILEDSAGWTIVDTGLNTRECRASWDIVIQHLDVLGPVRRVVCTHMHPDHIGLAGWLCDRFNAPLFMTRLEYVTARMLLADTGPAPANVAPFYRAAGWDAGRIESYNAGYGRFAQGVWPFPADYRRIADGDTLCIGDDAWTVVVGDGHSPEHACLWRQSDGVFIAGDQILPRISSNISVWPTEPEADPLGDWLSSIERLSLRLPENLLVLPGHGEPFTGVQPRLAALARGHAVALTRLERSLREPKRAVDVFGSLFARPVSDGLYAMATGESLAHLNYLLRQGRVRRERDADGVDWWQSTSPGD